jgi:hypothetical protein
MKPLIVLIALAGALSAPIGAHAQAFDDPFSDYLQRSDTILLGAGNANDANAAIHTITPWPPYVGNTHIPIDGRRSVQSVERMHRIPNPFEQQGTARPAGGSGPDGVAAAVNSLGNSAPTPVQPLSSGGY